MVIDDKFRFPQGVSRGVQLRRVFLADALDEKMELETTTTTTTMSLRFPFRNDDRKFCHALVVLSGTKETAESLGDAVYFSLRENNDAPRAAAFRESMTLGNSEAALRYASRFK